MRFVFFLAEEKLHQQRNGGEQYNNEDNHFEVRLQIDIKLLKEKFIKIMACENKRERPQKRPDDVIDQEARFIHLHDACNNRRERPYNRQKSRHDNGQCAMFLKKVLCLEKVFFLKQDRK